MGSHVGFKELIRDLIWCKYCGDFVELMMYSSMLPFGAVPKNTEGTESFEVFATV
jgi:hypothetical protein